MKTFLAVFFAILAAVAVIGGSVYIYVAHKAYQVRMSSAAMSILEQTEKLATRVQVELGAENVAAFAQHFSTNAPIADVLQRDTRELFIDQMNAARFRALLAVEKIASLRDRMPARIPGRDAAAAKYEEALRAEQRHFEQLISERRVAEGMTKRQVERAWGKPAEIERDRDGIELWTYHAPLDVLAFQNGFLRSKHMSDRPSN